MVVSTSHENNQRAARALVGCGALGYETPGHVHHPLAVLMDWRGDHGADFDVALGCARDTD